jgi:D-alanyl-D-alanine-carboxypeptidase/D-alanyl-D-alanine-endopeptidase
MFRRTISATAIQLALVLTLLSGSATADDKLLEETVKFTGEVLFLQSKVPALVVGVVRNGKTAVFGFGETSKGSAKPPDGNTLLRVGSLTKAFTGQVLASLVASKKLGFTDRLQERLGWNVIVPQRNGHEIRLIDLATHTSGLPEKWKENLAPPTIRSPR